MPAKPATVASKPTNSGVCKQKDGTCASTRIPFRKPPVLPRDSQRNSRAFGSRSAARRCVLFLHAISTCLTKGVKASILEESTETMVVNEGHRNESEVPISGSVGANPSLDPHRPLALSPDSEGREALLASSPEVRPPYLSLFINFDPLLRNTSSHSANCNLPFQSSGR